MALSKSFIRVALPFALLTVSACAPTFNAKVNRFQMMPAPQGQTFAIVAADAKLSDSLEFSQYASLIGGKLSALGYQAAPVGTSPSMVVTVDYGVDQGKEKLRTAPGSGFGYGFGPSFGYFDPWYRPRGYWPSAYRYGHYNYVSGFYDPFLFGSGYEEVENYTVFTSGLDMKIDSKAEGKRVFEGKAQAMSLNDNLTYLVPNLVEAMFTGFPGNSGETIKITVAAPKRM